MSTQTPHGRDDATPATSQRRRALQLLSGSAAWLAAPGLLRAQGAPQTSLSRYGAPGAL